MTVLVAQRGHVRSSDMRRLSIFWPRPRQPKAWSAKNLLDEVTDLSPEPRLGKSECVASTRLAAESRTEHLEAIDRLGNRRGILSMKEQSCRLVLAGRNNDVGRPAAAISNNGRTAGLGFDHGYAKIFFRGKYQGPCSLHKVYEHCL
jgi:hypothetical protein